MRCLPTTAPTRDRCISGSLPTYATRSCPASWSLPSTARLKERFQTSNATIQKALQLLKAEQLAVGRPGAAVTVREHRQQTTRPADFGQPAEAAKPYRWLTEAAKRGRQGSIKLLAVGEVNPPREVAKLLELADGETAVMRHQLLSLDGEPAELVTSYYPKRSRPRDGSRRGAQDPRRHPDASLGARLPSKQTVDRVSARVPPQEQWGAL